ncbi:hypothetical protein AHF37_12613 [Paragonimus kellicotti]|nr:hypothetical protein AHF37_12613 [Paragonimus kellicotti]
MNEYTAVFCTWAYGRFASIGLSCKCSDWLLLDIRPFFLQNWYLAMAGSVLADCSPSANHDSVHYKMLYNFNSNTLSPFFRPSCCRVNDGDVWTGKQLYQHVDVIKNLVETCKLATLKVNTNKMNGVMLFATLRITPY